MAAYISGLLLCAGLIVSIGPQNLELLRLGLTGGRAYLIATVFVCFDVLFVAVGVLGLGRLIGAQAQVRTILTLATAGLLFCLAWRACRRARQNATSVALGPRSGRRSSAVIFNGAALSLLNPLALLETVVILGTASASYAPSQKLYFATGAISSSIVWFYGLAGLSKHLARSFVCARHQRILEGVACTLLVGTGLWLVIATTRHALP